MTTQFGVNLAEYQARGVGAMIRSREEHWVFAHFGAALLAGVWMLREERLPEASAPPATRPMMVCICRACWATLGLNPALFA